LPGPDLRVSRSPVQARSPHDDGPVPTVAVRGVRRDQTRAVEGHGPPPPGPAPVRAGRTAADRVPVPLRYFGLAAPLRPHPPTAPTPRDKRRFLPLAVRRARRGVRGGPPGAVVGWGRRRGAPPRRGRRRRALHHDRLPAAPRPLQGVLFVARLEGAARGIRRN